MPIDALIKRNTYRDSVALMLLSTRLGAVAGVNQASAMMGTPANKDILRATGLLPTVADAAQSNDLLIVVDARGRAELAGALAEAERLLVAPASTEEASFAPSRPRSLERAVQVMPDANLAMISVPGEFAVFEARRALRLGLHVFLFSDNVPIEHEVELKQLAAERGLLLMGPDCGTALIGGAPLGFANAVRRGSIGLIASSGTGLQEVTCLIHRLGEGVSHAIGAGSRDLWAEVGGATFLAALDALAQDADTRVLVLISKPGAPAVQQAIFERLGKIGKPAVVYFLGVDPDGVPPVDGVCFAHDLEHTAMAAVALLRGQPIPWRGFAQASAEAIANRVCADASDSQRSVCGLFAGGTLAQEAASAIRRALDVAPDVAMTHEAGHVLDLRGHRIVDLGDDHFTRGRPHPMIDPRLRNEELVRRAGVGDVALFLVDVILGYGAHPNPAEAWRPALNDARAAARSAGGKLHVLASITGTDADSQDFHEQKLAFGHMGVTVADSSSVAALAAARTAAMLARR
jgi:succinyl-CoA synthetase alpha subunit